MAYQIFSINKNMERHHYWKRGTLNIEKWVELIWPMETNTRTTPSRERIIINQSNFIKIKKGRRRNHRRAWSSRAIWDTMKMSMLQDRRNPAKK